MILNLDLPAGGLPLCYARIHDGARLLRARTISPSTDGDDRILSAPDPPLCLADLPPMLPPWNCLRFFAKHPLIGNIHMLLLLRVPMSPLPYK